MATKAVRTNISGFLRGQFVQNVLHWLVIESGTVDDFTTATNVNAAIVAEMASYYLACLPEDYVGSSLRSQVITTVTHPGHGPVSVAQVGFNGEVGERTGTLAVTSIGPIIIAPFEVSGNPRSGKIYLPGVTETDVNNNRLTDELLDAIGALEDLLVALIAMAGSDTMKYQVYSPSEVEVYTPLGMYVSTQVGSIRNRQRPHG